MICGVDEAGRGPLAGPVYAAAVILNPDIPILGLADSKKLSARKREQLAVEIRAKALGWAIGSSTVEEIDSINILQATLLAMKRAVEGLEIRPVKVLVDGNTSPHLDVPVETIVRGDVSVPAISAASILAKTARDAVMLEYHRLFPEYGFNRHFGYGTSVHLEALRVHGPCSQHRRSFAPVRMLLGQNR